MLYRASCPFTGRQHLDDRLNAKSRSFGSHPSLSDNHGVRLSLKTINEELKRLGSPAVLTKADGYFYFQGGDAADWLDRAVTVPTLRSLTLEQWVGHYRALKAKNEALLQVKINSKDFGPRRAERMAGNSGAERPSAPNAVKRVAGKSVARRVPRKREETSKPETYLRLHHVPVFVRNQDLSLRFYLDQLGFRLIMDYNYGERGRFVLVAPPNGATLLALIAPKPDSAEYTFIGRSGQAVFVTENDMTRQIEARRHAMAKKAESERRAAQELAIAKHVQARLFPQTAPPLRTLEYAGVCVQAREVGGDYYDFLNLAPQRLGLVIGDISGKGIAAALLMANLQANLRSQCAMASHQPERFLQSVNQLFCDNTTDSAYATLFFAEYDDTERRLKYANCGHLPPLLIRRDGAVERLGSTATVVGIFKEWECSVTECQLFSGDTLVLYTDGVTESFNQAWEEFGERRLIESLKTYRELPPQAVIAAIVNRVKQFSPHEQHDDITLIVGKCRRD